MMKRIYLLLSFFLVWSYLPGQNLVPNPSFEDTVGCPIGGDQLYKAEHWSAFRFSPDYFHSCCNTINNSVVGVPSNDLGYQFAHSGNAYAGMITYDLTGAPYREYLGVFLSNSLTVGTKYFVSFYLNWSGKLGFSIATNKFGVVITDSLYTSGNPYPISNNPIAYSDSIVSDSVGWVHIRMSFIATTPANYLVFGNFFDDSNTDTVNLGLFNQHAYYYIDDVCLSEDSIYCDLFSTNLSILQSNISNDLLKHYHWSENMLILEFNDTYIFKQVAIYSITGKTIYQIDTDDASLILPFNHIGGIYIIRLQSNNKVQTLKLLR